MSAVVVTLLLSMGPGLLRALLRPDVGVDSWDSQWYLIRTGQDYDTEDASPDHGADEQPLSPPPIDLG